MLVMTIYLFAQWGEGETISFRLIKGSKSVTLFKRVTINMPHTVFHKVYGKGNWNLLKIELNLVQTILDIPNQCFCYYIEQTDIPSTFSQTFSLFSQILNFLTILWSLTVISHHDRVFKSEHKRLFNGRAVTSSPDCGWGHQRARARVLTGLECPVSARTNSVCQGSSSSWSTVQIGALRYCCHLKTRGHGDYLECKTFTEIWIRHQQAS